MLLEKASRNRDFVFVGESNPNFKALRGGSDRGSLAAVNVGSRLHASFPCVDGFRCVMLVCYIYRATLSSTMNRIRKNIFSNQIT